MGMPAAAGTMADMAGAAMEAGMVAVDMEEDMAGVAMEAGMAAGVAMEVEGMRAGMVAMVGMGELLVAMAAARKVVVHPARIPMAAPTGILIGIRTEILMVVPMACLHRRAKPCPTISTKARSLNV